MGHPDQQRAVGGGDDPHPESPGQQHVFGLPIPQHDGRDIPGRSRKLSVFNPLVQTIEYADYQYSYQFPPVNPPVRGDYIVFIAPPGRTRGRGPAGHADIIGDNYGLTSNVGYNADPFVATHGWNGSGSWEVHGYTKGNNNSGVAANRCNVNNANCNGLSRNSNLLNKYGKLGMRCAYLP